MTQMIIIIISLIEIMGGLFSSNVIGSHLSTIQTERKMKPEYEILNKYLEQPSLRVIEDFEIQLSGLMKCMSKLAGEKGDSAKSAQITKEIYEYWYMTNIMGKLLLERSKDMWEQIKVFHRKTQFESRVSESREDLKAYENLTLQYKRSLEEREQEVRKIKGEAERQKVLALQEKDVWYKSELNRLRQTIADLEDEKRLRDQYPAESSRSRNEKVAQLEKHLEARTNQLARVKSECNSLKSQKDDLAAKIGDLQRLPAQRPQSERDLQRVRQSYKSLEESSKAVQQKLQQTNEELERKLGQLKKHYEQAKRLVEQANGEKGRAVRQQEEKKQEIIRLKAALLQKQKELERGRANNSQPSDIENLRRESLQKELSITKAQLNQVFRELERNNQQLRVVKAELIKKAQKVEQERLSKQGDHQKRLSEETLARRKVQEDLRKAQQQCKQLKQNSEGYAKRIKDLQAQNSVNSRTLNSHEQQITSLRKAESELMQKNQRLQAQMQELKKSPKDEQLIEKLREQVQKLQSKNSDLRNDLERADHQSHMLEIRRRDNQIAQLKEQLKDQQALVKTKERQNQETYDEYRKETRDNEETIAYLRRKINELEEKVSQYE